MSHKRSELTLTDLKVGNLYDFSYVDGECKEFDYVKEVRITKITDERLNLVFTEDSFVDSYKLADLGFAAYTFSAGYINPHYRFYSQES